MQKQTIRRRIFKPEFQARTGYKDTWFRLKIADGTIPPGYRDPGGKRLWWPEEEVDATLARMQAAAVRAMPSKKATA